MEYYEVITLDSDCLSDSLQTLCAYARRTLCAYARRLQRNQSFVSNEHNYIDLVIAGTLSASFRNNDRMQHPSHQDEICRRAFSVAGPQEWNALPADIRNITDLSSFKRAIK